jgi:hypothetical protein
MILSDLIVYGLATVPGAALLWLLLKIQRERQAKLDEERRERMLKFLAKHQKDQV